jgi:hypothetical protein
LRVGDLDLVVAGDIYLWSTGTSIRVYENTGTSTTPVFANFAWFTVAEGSYISPRLVDLNNDGLLDLVVSARTTMEYFENRGSSTVPVFVKVTGRNNPFHSTAAGFAAGVALADMDADGNSLLSACAVNLMVAVVVVVCR